MTDAECDALGILAFDAMQRALALPDAKSINAALSIYGQWQRELGRREGLREAALPANEYGRAQREYFEGSNRGLGAVTGEIRGFQFKGKI